MWVKWFCETPMEEKTEMKKSNVNESLQNFRVNRIDSQLRLLQTLAWSGHTCTQSRDWWMTGSCRKMKMAMKTNYCTVKFDSHKQSAILNRLTLKSMNGWMDQSINQSINQSISVINQSTNQSINQSINQTDNQKDIQMRTSNTEARSAWPANQ